MDEIANTVYDVSHPSPLPLEGLAAIAVSTETWRSEIEKSRRNGTLRNFHPNLDMIMETVLSNVPSVLYHTIRMHFYNFEQSLGKWLEQHHTRVFHYNHVDRHDVLNHFHDFVADFKGEIHFVRTAEKMMRCEYFGDDEKFAIACTYCFEDDILRIWPSVSGRPMADVNNVNFNDNPQLYYWICRLKNEVHRVPHFVTVDEAMFDQWMDCNESSLIYFFERIPAERRVQKAAGLFNNDKEAFIRFILPRLRGEELREFINFNFDGSNMMYALMNDFFCDVKTALRVWTYVRSVINRTAFANFVAKMLRTEIYDEGFDDDGPRHSFADWVYLSCEIYNTAPDNLKRSSAGDILLNRTAYIDREIGYLIHCHDKDSKLLLNVLQYATMDEKNRFWRNHWDKFMASTRVEDLSRIMEQCFETADQMIEFKENSLVNSDIVRLICTLFLTHALFGEFNELVDFLFATPAAREFKQRILETAYLGRSCLLGYEIISEFEKFNDFITDVYGSAELSMPFRNQFSSSPDVQNALSILCRTDCVGTLEATRKFICAFFSEDNLAQVKTLICDVTEQYKNGNETIRVTFSEPRFAPFFRWCFDEQ